VQILISLFLGTFLAEDLTALSAGVLVGQGQISLPAAVMATGLGIFVSDLALWSVGRLVAPRMLRWPRIRKHIPDRRVHDFRRWFNRRTAVLMLGSRLLPGSRLPLYLGAGFAGGTLGRFAFWSAVGTTLWTPVLVLTGSSGVVPAAASATLFLAVGLHRRFRLARLRARVIAAASRIWRWEFWPPWVFYPPVAFWTLLLACRHRGFGAISAANPGMTDGGLVGESKYEILRRLPSEWTVPTVLIATGEGEVRARHLQDEMERRGWAFPVVLKPDVGQRGVGVRLVRSMEEARPYLFDETGAVLVQPYHEGPYEAGIFYYRKPSWAHGLILSITDKRFPVLIGDGTSSIEDLIWAHPRFRMQAGRFLARHASARGRVLGRGEPFVLARAGNHAQGTMFLDGSHLLTSALESRIDAIARGYAGFFIGRFDVRYRNPASFMAGQDLTIVELNGATAEATHIYDPARSLWNAYKVLFHQWRLVFEIGAANRARGAPVSSLRRLTALIVAHLASRPAHAVSD
jgi:membrane protein DedA with SNARE-associated domain